MDQEVAIFKVVPPFLPLFNFEEQLSYPPQGLTRLFLRPQVLSHLLAHIPSLFPGLVAPRDCEKVRTKEKTMEETIDGWIPGPK